MRKTRAVGILTSLAGALLVLTLMRWEVSRASASTASGNELMRSANSLPPYRVKHALAISTGTTPSARPAQRATKTTTPTPTPIITTTPRPDGSVVHVVEPGQVLWNIATAYKVSVAEIMALNNLTEKSVLYPGDKLLIKRAKATPTTTVTETISPTATRISPSNTPRPTRTPEPDTPTPNAAALSGSGSSTSGQPGQAGFKADPLLILIGVLVIIGAGLVLAGNVMKRKAKETTQPPEP